MTVYQHWQGNTQMRRTYKKPKRKMKYDKKRHMQSSWMTMGILNSINTKNMLYKTFIQANSQNVNLYRQLKEEYATTRQNSGKVFGKLNVCII